MPSVPDASSTKKLQFVLLAFIDLNITANSSEKKKMNSYYLYASKTDSM